MNMKQRVDFNAFRKDVEDALAKIGEKYGVDIAGTNISYGENDFSLKLSCTRNDIDVDMLNFKENCIYCGLKPEDYRRVFTIKGEEYCIVGVKPGNKYNIIIERLRDNTKYSYVQNAILEALGRGVA